MKTIDGKIEKLNKKIETFEERKKILEERKKKIEEQIKVQNENIADIRKEIKQLENEKQTLSLQDLLVIVNEKGVNIDELKAALITGDLLELQEKIEQKETMNQSEVFDKEQGEKNHNNVNELHNDTFEEGMDHGSFR